MERCKTTAALHKLAEVAHKEAGLSAAELCALLERALALKNKESATTLQQAAVFQAVSRLQLASYSSQLLQPL